MNFLSLSQNVEKPCKDLFTYPVQCFQEMFLATPPFVATFVLTIGGFALAVFIWACIAASALFVVYYILKLVLSAARYFFTKTRVGQKIAGVIPLHKYLQRFCCKAQEVQPKKFISTQAIGDFSSNIVSKAHVDSKWFKSALKHVPFTKSNDVEHASNKSPSKTPQRSTSRISALTPKILSPKSHKQ